MNRRFKVFDKKNQKFVEDHDYYLDSNGDLCQNIETETGYFFMGYAKNNLIPIYSTGITDKNEKEYEDGSLFKVIGTLYEVYWSEIEAGFKCRTKNSSQRYHNLSLNSWLECLKKFEIIGSSLTNPELLEK